MRLTLRTLLAYLDDTLEASQAREIGKKLSESTEAQELVERIRRATRRRSLGTPATDPLLVSAYLSDTLAADSVALFEQQCLESEPHLAEVAAVHQILSLLLTEQARVPPSAKRRMYSLVTGRESLPNRKPGNTIPIGGVREVERSGDDADDAAYLLGMPRASRKLAPQQVFVKVALGVLLTLLVATSAVLAWPTRKPLPREVAPKAETPVPLPAPPEVAPLPRAVVTTPADDATPDADPPATPPAETPAQPPAPAPVEIEVPQELKPSSERSALGMAAVRPDAILTRLADDGVVTRVTGNERKVYSGEAYTALPGYKSDLEFDTGLVVRLWGNLPELLPTPLPLFESAVKVFAPTEAVGADLELVSGRVYLSATKANPRPVRLRVGSRVWDLELAESTRLAAEVAHSLTPPGDPTTTRSRGGLYLTAGTLKVTPRVPAGEPFDLKPGDAVYFDSRVAESRTVPANPADGSAAYWNAFVTPGDAKRAELALAALDEFAAKLSDPARVRETFAGGLPRSGVSTPESIVRARVAIFSLAAVHDVKSLADAILDSERPLVRTSAVEGLRAAAANDAGLLTQFRAALKEIGTADADAQAAVDLLRGIDPSEQGSAEQASRVVERLGSPSLAVRELAYGLLRGAVDPESPDARALYSYDPGAPATERAVAVNAWRAWAKVMVEKKAKPD